MHEVKSIKPLQVIAFILSLIIAIGYGMIYFRHEIGISPFHISATLPDVDVIVLIVTVLAPLALGIILGLLSGKLKWFAIPIYPVVIGLSLF